MNKAKAIGGAAVLFVAAVGAGSVGFVALQGKIFDDKVREFSTIDNGEVEVILKEAGSSFWSRTTEITGRFKDSRGLEIKAVANTEFGLHPTVVVSSFSSNDPEFQKFLAAVSPQGTLSCDYRFQPQNLAFGTREGKTEAEGAKFYLGRISSFTDFTDAQSIKPSILSSGTKASVNTVAIEGPDGSLTIDSQNLDLALKEKPDFGYSADYRVSGVSLKSADQAVVLQSGQYLGTLAQDGSSDVQNSNLKLNDLELRTLMKIKVDQADVKTRLTWPKDLSLISAFRHLEFGDKYCGENPAKCSGPRKDGELLLTHPREVESALMDGKIKLDILPSELKNKDYTLTLSGEIHRKPNVEQFGSIQVKLVARKESKLLPLMLFLPKNTYSMPDNKTITSEITADFNGDDIFIKANGAKVFSTEFR